MKSIIVIGRALLPQGTMTAEIAENAEKNIISAIFAPSAVNVA